MGSVSHTFIKFRIILTFVPITPYLLRFSCNIIIIFIIIITSVHIHGVC